MKERENIKERGGGQLSEGENQRKREEMSIESE